MIFNRGHHGLQKIDLIIYAFGGGFYEKYRTNTYKRAYTKSAEAYKRAYTKSAEAYDVVQNQWIKLPDMPEVGFGVT